MPELGGDCDLILTHALVNQGMPSGFMLEAQSTRLGKAVRISREVISDERLAPGGTRVTVRCDLLLADQQLNPDGSPRQTSRLADYALLLAYLAQREGITLQCSAGIIANLGALGFAAVERHGDAHSLVHIALNNAGYYFPPADPERFNQSVWDGLLSWDAAYWR